MSIISIAGVTNSQTGYEFPDYQEKIEQLQKQISNLQSTMGKVNDGSDDVSVKQQRVEMIQSQISQIQSQIQRLETMEHNRDSQDVSAKVMNATEFLNNQKIPDELTEVENKDKKEKIDSEVKLDIRV